MKKTNCTITRSAVLSIKQSHMPDKITTNELTDEELELVVGGQSRHAYEQFRCAVINALNYEALRENEQRNKG